MEAEYWVGSSPAHRPVGLVGIPPASTNVAEPEKCGDAIFRYILRNYFRHIL